MTCDCHLAWLFRFPKFRVKVINEQCKNGTYFSELLTAKDLLSCPEDPTAIMTTKMKTRET